MERYNFNQIYPKDDDEKFERPIETPEIEEKGEKGKKETYDDVFEKIFPRQKSSFGKD